MPNAINLVTDVPGPRATAILERKRRVVANPLDVHVPTVVDHASGARLVDVDGNTWLDFAGGLGAQMVGYSHPRIVEAVRRQAERVSHTDFSVVPYESYVELGERLVDKSGFGGAGKVAFFNAGAEAVENAVKFARAATGRPAVVCFEGGFHGRTLLTMTMTSRYRPYKAGFGPFAPEVYRLPYAYPYRSAHPESAAAFALQEIERIFATQVDPSSVACAVIEPIQGEGGFVVPPAEFLQGVERICRQHGIVIVADEIQSGCGRAGTFLAGERSDFHPDLVTLAKALAAGYPLSAVVGREEIVDAPGPSAIGGTYVGNPVACAAANAVMQVIDEEGLLDRAEQVGKILADRWSDIASSTPEVGEVRGAGSMVGVEFVRDPASKEPNEGFLAEVVAGAMRRGLITVTCGAYHNVLRHLIPLAITDEELHEGLDVLADAVAGASTAGGRTDPLETEGE